MSRRASTDSQYLAHDQYRDASKLNARIELHRRFSVNPRDWHAWAFDRLPAPGQARVLEAGCGSGLLWSRNSGRLTGGWQVVLGDLSTGMVRDARRSLSSGGGRVGYAVLDVQALPFARGAFDVVIANHMLYHVPGRPKALLEIRRVLRDGGRLFAATNGRRHMAGLLELVARFEPALAAKDGTAGLEDAFSLETGREQLLQVFPRVELHRYEDALAVTEVGPLVDYICSMEYGQPLLDRRNELVAFLGRELAEKGAIRIEKATGLFEASGR